MSQFFALDYNGAPFEWLGGAHLGALTGLVLLNLGLLLLRRASPNTRAIARWILAISIWAAEASWHVWNVAVGSWNPQVMLPLNLCSILIWLSGIMLARKDVRLFEFVYFLGIGGAILYLVTPDLGRYGFPHFRFFQAYASHGLLLTAPLFLVLVEGFRPTLGSLKRVIAGVLLYMIPVFFLNRAIDSNFLMLNHKPSTPSLLDLLPAWPYYIFCMALIGLLSCAVLYLPFAVADARLGGRGAAQHR